jgi:O-acetyl-ADP-ribose deacetylase (regulator of RNase III)
MDTTNLDALLSLLLTENGSQLIIPDSLYEKRKLLRILLNVRSAELATEDLISRQNRELQEQLQEKGIVDVSALPSCPLSNRLILWQGDVTRLKADAIVNAANSALLGCFSPLHNCIDNAIHSAAGVQLRWECHQIMLQQGSSEPTGLAKITSAYNLPAQHVIHTVGPIIGNKPLTLKDEQLLASSYQSCLLLAQQCGLKSIAFCCISTGVFGFPNQRAAEIAVETVLSFFNLQKSTPIEKVVFNVFKDTDYDIYRKLLY